jgi:hypothetical protein
MFAPGIASWIEMWNELIGFGIVAGDIGPFRSVASRARNTGIGKARRASVFAGTDVVKFVWKRRQRLRKLAVFAQATRPLPDLHAKGSGHMALFGIGGMNDETRLGVDQVQELAYSKESLEQNALVGRDRTPIVLLKQPPNARGGLSIEPKLQ